MYELYFTRREFGKMLAVGCASFLMGCSGVHREIPVIPIQPPIYSAKSSPSLERIRQKNTGLADELELIPEIKDGISAQEESALEKMLKLYQADELRFDLAINDILKIGLPKYRKYCSPLQAFTWLFFDNKETQAARFIKYNKLNILLEQSWGSWLNTPRPDRWIDFETSVNRINSPELANYFSLYFLTHDNIFLHSKFSVEKTFKLKTGVGWQFSNLMVYCLEHNGYNQDGYSISNMVVDFSDYLHPRFYLVGAVFKNPNGEWYFLGGHYSVPDTVKRMQLADKQKTPWYLGPFSDEIELQNMVFVLPEHRKNFTGKPMLLDSMKLYKFYNDMPL